MAAIGKDAGFNDDGLVDAEGHVTAGAKSATETITYDIRNYLNIAAVAFRKDGGSTKVPGSQSTSSSTPLTSSATSWATRPRRSRTTRRSRRVAPEPGGATTDFLNDNPSATASSSQPVTQTVTAVGPAAKNTVDANGDRVPGNAGSSGQHHHQLDQGRRRPDRHQRQAQRPEQRPGG